jgi:hypothetical protein
VHPYSNFSSPPLATQYKISGTATAGKGNENSDYQLFYKRKWNGNGNYSTNGNDIGMKII